MTADDFKGRLRFLKAFDAGLDCDDSAPEAYGAQNLGISEDRRENPTGMNIQRETAEGTEFRNCRIRSTPAVSRAWTKMQAMRHAGAWCSGGAVLRPGKTLPIDGGRLRWGPLDGRNASHAPCFVQRGTKMQAMRRSAPAGSECADSRCPHAGSQMRAVGRAVFGCK